MKVSTKVEYGLVALTDIALNTCNDSSVTALGISERNGISQKYLEQIMPSLKQAGLIKAQKGLKGGYTLAKPAESIRMSDILNALDNNILANMESSGKNEGFELREVVNNCLWKRLNYYLVDFSENLTFADFLQECRQQAAKGWDMYVI